MTLTVKKITKWETSDGTEHSSKEMAHAYILNAQICELFDHIPEVESQDIVNVITSHAKAIREFLDASDAMEKALYK
jgi:hypothetical protein